MPRPALWLGPLEAVLWILQILVLLLAWRGPNTASSQEPSKIGLLLALTGSWAWRLAYAFVLSSSGFWYFVADDTARWQLSYLWARHPYLITWDGVWQGATFYIHGLAMQLVPDPLVASKLVTSVLVGLPLVGLLVFTQALWRDRLLSIAAVVVAAPWWLHILLGTGALAELPTTGLILAGAGLLFKALARPGPAHPALLFASATCFSAATAFHIVAWMILLSILGGLLLYALGPGRREGSFSLRVWVWFSGVSLSYVAVWVLGCWVKFHDPLYFVRHYAQLNLISSGVLPLRERFLAYPWAIAYSLWPVAPALIIGLFLALSESSPAARRHRAALGIAAGGFVIMVASALRGNPGGHPFRSTLPFATFLLPFALVPYCRAARNASWSHWKRAEPRRVAGAIALVLLSGTWILDNQQKLFTRQRLANDLDADAIALGAWLRLEMIRPQSLRPVPDGLPIRLWHSQPDQFRSLAIVYASGNPGWIEQWHAPATPGIDSLRPGQYLITDQPVADPRIEKVTAIGRYAVYLRLADRR